MLAEQWFGPIGVVFGTVFEVVVIFVLFEAVPKNWAVHNPESAALFRPRWWPRSCGSPRCGPPPPC